MDNRSAETDFFRATRLLEQGQREEGLQALASLLEQHEGWLKTRVGRPLYEAIQVQRAFSLMHLQKNSEAKPLLEEATISMLTSKLGAMFIVILGAAITNSVFTLKQGHSLSAPTRSA